MSVQMKLSAVMSSQLQKTCLWSACISKWKLFQDSDVTKDHPHRKNSSLQHLLAKSCSQFSGMLEAWCIQNSYLLAQDFTIKWQCEKLGKLKAWLQPLFPHMEQPVLQYDNWISARSIQTQCLGFTTLDCSGYSPDFGLSEFHLPSEVKEQLTGHHYIRRWSRDSGHLVVLSSNAQIYYNGLTKLLEHWWKHVDWKDDYVGK